MTPQISDNVPYLRPLTGIRALAALLVLALHAEQNVPARVASILPFVSSGHLGVDFFFILSGFIITHVYLSRLARFDRRAVLIFLWHRLIRLYPVHITVLAALVLLIAGARAAGVTLNNPQDWRMSDLVWHLTLLHAWGVVPTASWNAPSWSISAEWFAYLLFPILATILIRVRSAISACAIAVGALIAMAALFWIAGWELNSWTGGPALARVSGEFLCEAAICRAVSLRSNMNNPVGDLLGGSAFAAFLIAASLAVPDIALVGLLALTIFGVAMANGVVAAALASRPLFWLGEISYSIYMVHFPVLLLMRRVWERAGFADWGLFGRSLAFVATILLVIGLAAMLFYLVERPARLGLRDRFGKLASA